MIIIYVAADIYAQKVNLQFEYTHIPTLGELFHRVEQVFSNECRSLRPPGVKEVQKFGIEKLQIYGDEISKDTGKPIGWKDLNSASQLSDRAQLYVFQSDPNVQESQQKINRHLSRKPSEFASLDSAKKLLNEDQPLMVDLTTSALNFHTSMNGTPSRLTAKPVSPVVVTRELQSALRDAERLSTPLMNKTATVTTTATATPRPELSPIRFRLVNSNVEVPLAPTVTSAVSVASQQTSRTPTPLPTLVSTAPSYASLRHPGERASETEKQRYLFSVISQYGGTSEVRLEGLRRFLEDHHYGMASTLSIADLFSRSDVDKSGGLSFVELNRFFGFLPTLLESLYFRLLDAEDYNKLVAVLHGESKRLDVLSEKKADVVRESQRIENDIYVADMRCAEAKDTADVLSRQMQSVKDTIRSGEQEIDALERDRRECSEDAKRQASSTEQIRTHIVDCRRKWESVDAYAKQGLQKLRSLEDRVNEIRRMLEQAEREYSAQQQLVESAARDASLIKAKESELVAQERELHQGVKMRVDRVTELESTEKLRRQEVNSLHSSLRQSEERLNEQEAARAKEQANIDAMRKRYADLMSHAQQFDLERAEQEQRIRRLEDTLAEFEHRKAATEQRERVLLEQELRLRSQRDALDEQESQLRQEVGALFFADNQQHS